jgi:hypothetical protein
MMLPPVFTTLKNAPDVTDIVASRIYRQGAAPQDTTRPYVTWFLVTGTPENELSATPSIDRMTVQIDCWHQTDAGVEALAVAVRDACEPLAHMTSIVVNEREPETKLYRFGLQFDWFVSRLDTVPAGALDYLALSGDAAPGQLLLSGDEQTNGDVIAI